MKRKYKEQHLWKTPIERAIFGYNIEIDIEQGDRFDEKYLENLILQEKNVLSKNAQSTRSLTFFVILSLIFIEGLKLDVTIFGKHIDHIPASPQILSLLLGLSIFGFVITTLDVILVARMRSDLAKKKWATDLPNIATGHLKGVGLWADIFSIQFVHFASGWQHVVFALVAIVAVVGFLLCIVFISLATLIGIYSIALDKMPFAFNLSTIISTSGLVIGAIAVFILIVALFIPFKYTMRTPIES